MIKINNKHDQARKGSLDYWQSTYILRNNLNALVLDDSVDPDLGLVIYLYMRLIGEIGLLMVNVSHFS